MTWTSKCYAHQEDVRIAQLLGDRPLFAIDIGAQEPLLENTFWHNYEIGGLTINIEPIPTYYELLKIRRPKDITLQYAISNAPGWKTIYELPHSGLSTFRQEYAQQFGGRYGVNQIDVECITLAHLCETWVPPEQTIDVLKIDVEGHEKEVLEGADFTRWRPTIMCIEATHPGTEILCAEEWEPIVLAAGYERFAFDGCNLWFREAPCASQ
jgi:FkbM family methyltransferase